MAGQFKFSVESEQQYIRSLPSVAELTLGQQIVAEHCSVMMEWGKRNNALEIYDYYRRLADVISDQDLAPLVCPLIFRGQQLIHDFHSSSTSVVERHTQPLRKER